MKRFKSLWVAAVLSIGWVQIAAALSVPAYIGDGMVVQRDKPVILRGWAEPGAAVSVLFAGDAVKVKAGADGAWTAELPARPAGGPFEIVFIEGEARLVVKDVLVGDVWICSGQSNMVWPVSSTTDAEEAKTSDLPRLRAFATTAQPAATPQADLPGEWSQAVGETVLKWSGTGFYFGRKLHRELDVPIGLLFVAWGGTPAEAWLPIEDLRKLDFTEPWLRDNTVEGYTARYPELLKNHEAQKERLTAAGNTEALKKLRKPATPETNPQLAAVQYNNRIAPLVGFPVRGAIWYQGESNANGLRSVQYGDLMTALIQTWRGLWKDEFPFGVVQLTAFRAPQTEPVEPASTWAAVREQQMKIVRAVPKTGLAVIIDLGEADDIHPSRKTGVGERLADWALCEVYGRKDLASSGPLYRSMKKSGSEIRIAFDHAAGLRADSGEVLSLAIAGADRVWKSAKGRIENDELIVASPEVPDPVAVRYGWADNPPCNLFNGADHPASPFRTDDWPIEFPPPPGG